MEQYAGDFFEWQMTKINNAWVGLSPRLRSPQSRNLFVGLARTLVKARREREYELATEKERDRFLKEFASCRRSDRQTLLASGLVLCDLSIQGWLLRVRNRKVEVSAPVEITNDRLSEKARIRTQELIRRNAQLRHPAVQKFLSSMEQSRLFNGKFSSIFSLMRDGRELSGALRKARAHTNNGWSETLASIVDPYLEFVTSDQAICPFTGHRLMDIWRYFRHTWSNQYTSVPGRSMMFLVRDQAAPFHPVVGIGALSSPVVQIRERDIWIGWHPESFLARVRSKPTAELARWLVRTVDTAIAEIYVDDLREEGIVKLQDLTKPSDKTIQRLLQESIAQRKLHHRFVRAKDLKNGRPRTAEVEHWVGRARTHLFRSKRALSLASLLYVRAILKQAFGDSPSAEKLSVLAATGKGGEAIRKILKKAKADRVGIAVADITVCGAVQPYNALVAGKLVAMLAASPEIVVEYQRRYSTAESEIASSMAGRPIVRTPTLVLLGTTSLYGVGSSQYNRITIPCDRVGGTAGDEIRYQALGHSEAFGTSQYSEETVDALTDMVHHSTNGERVNSIFGEGVSPKLRKIRQGLDLLGLPTEFLLRHHRRRIVYAVSLARNVPDYLLGLDLEPKYLLPVENGRQATMHIAAWWRERWLRKRIQSDEVLAQVARHTLIRPISHGARVVIPVHDQRTLFAEDF
jgi:hypothetical protein